MRRRFGTALALVAGLATGMPRVVLAAPPAPTPPASSPDSAAPEPADPDAARPHVPAADDPEAIALEKRIEEAERHFIEGRTLFDQKRYLEAATEFERSFAAIERAETLYNIALSYEYGSRPVEAIRAARRYRALPDCENGQGGMCAKKRAEVKATEQRLLAKVGQLELELQEGVVLREIRIDGQPVPEQDFPVLLMPGTYELEMYGARKGQQRMRYVELEAGSKNVVPVLPFLEPRPAGDTGNGDRVDVPDPEDLAAEKRRLERRKRALTVSFWSGLGLTVASGAATATFGALKVRAERRHDEAMCELVPGSTECVEGSDANVPELVNSRADAKRYRTLTNAMVGVTAAIGVTTALIGIFAFSKQPARRGSQRWGLGPGGLVVHW